MFVSKDFVQGCKCTHFDLYFRDDATQSIILILGYECLRTFHFWLKCDIADSADTID